MPFRRQKHVRTCWVFLLECLFREDKEKRVRADKRLLDVLKGDVFDVAVPAKCLDDV